MSVTEASTSGPARSSGWRDLSSRDDGIVWAHQSCGEGPPVLFVHGIGPGTTGSVNFAPLLTGATGWTAHLIDLVGFGASGRKTAPPFFDVALWLRQINEAVQTIRALHGRMPLLVGNSVGGALVLKLAARRPDIERVIAIAAPVGPPATEALRAFWQVPRDEPHLARMMRPMNGDMREPDAGSVGLRMSAFRNPVYAKHFATMLADPAACLGAFAMDEAEASSIRAPLTLVHGTLDRACPVGDTVSRMRCLPQADLLLLGGCGHNVISERTDQVRELVARESKGDG